MGSLDPPDTPTPKMKVVQSESPNAKAANFKIKQYQQQLRRQKIFFAALLLANVILYYFNHDGVAHYLLGSEGHKSESKWSFLQKDSLKVDVKAKTMTAEPAAKSTATAAAEPAVKSTATAAAEPAAKSTATAAAEPAAKSTATASAEPAAKSTATAAQAAAKEKQVAVNTLIEGLCKECKSAAIPSYRCVDRIRKFAKEGTIDNSTFVKYQKQVSEEVVRMNTPCGACNPESCHGV